MKNLFISTACFLFTSVGYCGIVFHWSGDNTLTDSVQNRAVSFIGNTAYSEGVFNSAFNLSGQTFLSTPDSVDLNFTNSDFSVSLWINHNSINFSKDRVGYIGHNEGSGNRDKWVLWLDGWGNHINPDGSSGSTELGLRFHVEGPSIPPVDNAVYQWTPNLHTWYHLTAVRDSNNYKLYIDGSLVENRNSSYFPNDPATNLTIG